VSLKLYLFGYTEVDVMALKVPLDTQVFAPVDGVWHYGGCSPLASTLGGSTACLVVGVVDSGGCPTAPCPIILPHPDYQLNFKGQADRRSYQYVSTGQPIDKVEADSIDSTNGPLGAASGYNLIYGAITVKFDNPILLTGTCLSGGVCTSKFDIGSPVRTGDQISVPFELTADGPAGCQIQWASDLSAKDNIYLVPNAAGGRASIGILVTLVDATGVAGMDGPLNCGTKYDGAWIFNVGTDPGPWWMFYPDFADPVHGPGTEVPIQP
jgi:hypothetical protein